MSLFAMLPSPIIYGAIIDNTCLLWQEECGETTNCLLYDTDKLREALMLTTAGNKYISSMYLYQCISNLKGIMFLGVLFDAAVVYYAKDLKIFDDEEKNQSEELGNIERCNKFQKSFIILTHLFRIDRLKVENSEYNMVYGSAASLSKDSTLR